jgi:PAS domain S-box-containing protein
LLPAQAEIVLFWGSEFIAFYNDAYAPTIGRKHPHALGRPAREYWSELWDDLGPLLEQVRSTGKTLSAKDRPFRINRQGEMEEVFFDISYSAVRVEDGSVGGVLCIVSETTERIRALEALRRSEQAGRASAERIELALDAGAVMGTWVWDIPNDRVTGDERFARTFSLGDAPPHILSAGFPLAQVVRNIHPEDQPRLNTLIREAMERGGDFRAEYRVQHTDAGWLWIEASGRVERDAAGRPVRFPGVLVDIDARIRAQEAQRLAAVARYKAEQALRETHDQLRLAQSAGGIGVFSLDIGKDEIAVSEEFCRIYGISVAASVPASAIEALRYCEEEHLSSRQSRSSGEARLDVEYRIRRADDGEVRWIARRAEFVRDGLGKPVTMRGVVQDITARKLAEATLRESEARFRALAQAVPNQVWTAGRTGTLDWFNQRVYDYSGLTRDRLLGHRWSDIVHPEDQRRVAKGWQRALATQTPYETELRLRRHDGHHRWHLVRALPVANQGEGVRWIGTNTDIDDQKAAQQALSLLNATLEERVAERTRERDRMWRLSTEIMLVADFEARIVSVNPAWKLVLGWSEAELIGKSFMDLVHEEDLAASRAEHLRIAGGHATLRFENRLRHRDGTYRTIHWTAVPDEHFIHAVGRDSTAERESERALRDTEARLRQSQKMEALGQLTGGIAHDFNNLLQGITGAIEILKRRLAAGRTDGIDRFLGSAAGSAQRAAALVHRLLAFARRQSLDSKAVDLNALVASMEDLLQRTLGEQVGLHIGFGERLWPALSDENQLESAILNLAINARDAMPEGGMLSIDTRNATLTESYTRQHDGLGPGDYVVVAVTDTGTGMPPDVLAKAFDPFFTTKPIGQGTGLGLSMIYGFAKQSGGHVRILSEVGHGTTVELYCPRYRESTAPQSHASAPPEPSELPRGAGETVLVVEDDPNVRLLVLDVLRELGYRTIEAPDGLAALPILESARGIDLLISDVGLPGMNGRQVAEIGRRHRPRLPVLFMTGYAEKATVRSEFLGEGMHMVTKPFTMDTLAVQVRDILGRRGPPTAG